MTALEIAIEALEEIADSDYSFEGHACLHCEMAMDALNKIKREAALNPEVAYATTNHL